MKIGVSTFLTDEGIGPAALARALEERGFESLFTAEHTHIPTSRESPYPGGGDLPRVYYRSIDPFVGLGAAAGVTQHLLVGTGICLVAQRDPIVLAKEVATLDHISGGRFMFGIGAGWNREEMRDHGTDPTTRMALLRERVLAMKELWTGDEAEFHGRFVDFDPVFSWPKPVQRPHPPILVGGGGPTTFDRVLEYGDAWMPIAAQDPDELAGPIARLRQQANDRGRAVSVSVFSAPTNREHLERYAELGVERVNLHLATRSEEETLRRLDGMVDTAKEFMS